MRTAGSYGDRTKKERRRLLLRALLTAMAKVTGLIVLYFVVPLDKSFSPKTLIGLAIAMIAVIFLGYLEYRATLSSPYPRLTAAAGMFVVIAIFVTAFAMVYYLMVLTTPSSFNSPMTRLDSLYFTTTTLTTVGYGDIAATSETARAVATVQMFADLILIGVVVRALMNAINSGLTLRNEREASGDLPAAPEPS